MIKCIIFDIGKVLIDFDFRHASAVIAEDAGTTPDELEAFLLKQNIFPKLDAGIITVDDLIEMLRKKYGLEMPLEEIKRVWCSIFTGETPGMRKLLEQTGEKYELACLSNINHVHYEFIRDNYTVLDLFRRQFISYRMKLAKPDPAIFESALRELRYAPEECVFIDDLPENVSGAEKAGIRSFVFKDSRSLHRALDAAHIL